MATFLAQLNAAVRSLQLRQRDALGPHQGGWGVLDEPRAPSSIVNTAEAVSVYALAGVPLDDDSLDRGLRYLRAKVTLHIGGEQRHAQARGRKPRYAAYGLLGLTAYPHAFDHDEHARAAGDCVTWLQRHTLDEPHDRDLYGCGWSEHPHLRHVSLLSTSIAALALDRIPPGQPGAKRGVELARSARRRIRRLARGTPDRRWWPMQVTADDRIGDEAAGAAVTALAVLALANGGPTSQGYARAGVRWLIDRRHRWEQHREPEFNIHDANWLHISCALGLRAVLVPCAGIDPQRQELAVAISYLDRLWSPQHGEWRHGHPSADVSTSADLHCASAIAAMREAWRGFDPITHLLKGRPRRTETPGPGGARPVEVRWSEGTLAVLGANGSPLATRRFSRHATAMRALLDALTQHHAAQSESATQLERSLTGQELQMRTGITDVYEYVRRLNKHLSDAALEQNGRPCLLVQRIESGAGPDHDRYVLVTRRTVLEGSLHSGPRSD